MGSAVTAPLSAGPRRCGTLSKGCPETRAHAPAPARTPDARGLSSSPRPVPAPSAAAPLHTHSPRPDPLLKPKRRQPPRGGGWGRCHSGLPAGLTVPALGAALGHGARALRSRQGSRKWRETGAPRAAARAVANQQPRRHRPPPRGDGPGAAVRGGARAAAASGAEGERGPARSCGRGPQPTSPPAGSRAREGSPGRGGATSWARPAPAVGSG